MYGGKLSDGYVSNELWHFDVMRHNWSLRAVDSHLSPPKLTRHTLTRDINTNWLYLFGGSTVEGEFSSRLFRIKLDLGK